MEISYGQYLRLDELLSLQKERATPAAEDELLFITIHQVYELWFKEILHESAFLCSALKNGDAWPAARKIRRILVILKLLVQQVDVLETMTPRGFACFRDFLETSSGLQSCQFRELEILCGWRHHEALYSAFAPGSIEHQKIKKRLQEPTIWEFFCTFLIKYDVNMPTPKVSDKPYGIRHLPNEQLQDCLIELIKTHPEVETLAEFFVDLEEGLQEWRYRHVKMVERIIGNSPGTGGTSGMEYLKATVGRQLFPDIWAIRGRF